MSMKFIPLDGKKKPPFKKKVVISFADGGWTEATLSEIRTTDAGEEFIFVEGENEYNNATHFLLPEPPIAQPTKSKE